MSWVYCVRPVPGRKGYFADITGGIWSQRTRSGRLGAAVKRLRQTKGRHGYLRVSLSVNSDYKKAAVHRLVVASFRGPSTLQVRHLDGNPANNRLENLKHGTYEENWEDRKRHGNGNAGEDAPKAKLTWAEVREIRTLEGLSQQKIAEAYGVSQSVISSILLGKTWVD